MTLSPAPGMHVPVFGTRAELVPEVAAFVTGWWRPCKY